MPPEVKGLKFIEMGVRPEHFQADSGRDGMQVQVTLVENLGMNYLVSAVLPEGQQEFRLLMNAPCPAVGDMIQLSVAPENIHWFHPETGMRLTP